MWLIAFAESLLWVSRSSWASKLRSPEILKPFAHMLDIAVSCVLPPCHRAGQPASNTLFKLLSLIYQYGLLDPKDPYYQ